MKKYKKEVLIIIFLIGISLLLYPVVGNIINSYAQKKVLDSYVEKTNVISNEENEKLYQEAVSYNEEVYARQRDDHRYDLADKYENVLKIDSTMVMGYIEVPKANIKLPIYHGVADNVLQKGVGHVRESSLPIGTNNQNSLLMGHTGLPTSKIFTNLEKLKIGDYFKITILHNELYYKIIKIEVIEPKELINKLPIEENRDLVTLVTCTPYGVNSHRLVLQAERTDAIPEEGSSNVVTRALNIKDVIMIIASLLLFIGVIYLFIIKRKVNKSMVEPPKEVIEVVNNKKSTKKNTKKKKRKKKKKKKKQKQKVNKKKKKKGRKHAKKH